VAAILSNAKPLCGALLMGLSLSMAAQSPSAGHVSPTAPPRFAQTSQAHAPDVDNIVRYSYYSGTLPDANVVAGTNFYFLGTVASPDSVQQHSNELVIPAERVQERPGERIVPMPRVGED